MHPSVSHSNLQSSFPLILHFLLILPFGQLGAQTRMVPAKGTPTIKSAKDSTLGCQSTVDNDIPDSWNLRYLYYLNGPSLVGRIRGFDRA